MTRTNRAAAVCLATTAIVFGLATILHGVQLVLGVTIGAAAAHTVADATTVPHSIRTGDWWRTTITFNLAGIAALVAVVVAVMGAPS